MGLRQILTDYLKSKSPQYVHGGDLESVAKNSGYEGETAKRRLREMTQLGHASYDPDIGQTLKEGCVMYRYLPLERQFNAKRQDCLSQPPKLRHEAICHQN